MTADIICFKATFHAMCEKFELMHTGEKGLAQDILAKINDIPGDITVKELTAARDKKTRMTIYDKRIRFICIQS